MNFYLFIYFFFHLTACNVNVSCIIDRRYGQIIRFYYTIIATLIANTKKNFEDIIRDQGLF